jgi:hypothetical protein
MAVPPCTAYRLLFQEPVNFKPSRDQIRKLFIVFGSALNKKFTSGTYLSLEILGRTSYSDHSCGNDVHLRIAGDYRVHSLAEFWTIVV